MRHFVLLLLLLLVVEVTVDKLTKKQRQDMCKNMFKEPMVADKRCNDACRKYMMCVWGYRKRKNGRKRCFCKKCHKRESRNLRNDRH